MSNEMEISIKITFLFDRSMTIFFENWIIIQYLKWEKSILFFAFNVYNFRYITLIYLFILLDQWPFSLKIDYELNDIFKKL